MIKYAKYYKNCTKNNANLIKNCIMYYAKMKNSVLVINKRGKTKRSCPVLIIEISVAYSTIIFCVMLTEFEEMVTKYMPFSMPSKLISMRPLPWAW